MGSNPEGVAVTPDGNHVYVTNSVDSTVSVIDTATNTVEAATLAVGSGPVGVAVTPDGAHAYVTNAGSNNVSVIDTATNTVEAATLAVGNNPESVGIVPPPGVPFSAFSTKLTLKLSGTPNQDSFDLASSFTLSSSASPGINPLVEAVTLQIGTFTTTIPPGSFKGEKLAFNFTGVIDGVSLDVLIKPTGTLRYAFLAKATGANLDGTENAVYVTLIIGDNSGATSVTAKIF